MSELKYKSSFATKLFYWGIIICCLVFLALTARLNFIKEPNTSPANACINNMRQIDAAINEWALINGKTKGTVVTVNDIKPYIKLNSKGNVPPCPSGGTYNFGKVGEPVTCSLGTNVVPAHVLP